MGRYGIDWGENENKLTKEDYDKIFIEASKIINEKILDKEEISIAYYSRGIIYQDREELIKALSDYTFSIEYQDNYQPAYYNRGGVFFLLKQYENALTNFQKALELKPEDNDAKIWVNYLESGKFVSASLFTL